MPERSNGAVSKTVDLVRGPGVRIPLSPPSEKPAERRFFISEKIESLLSGFRRNKEPDAKRTGFEDEAPLSGDLEQSEKSPKRVWV
jgi:hypothetical protein